MHLCIYKALRYCAIGTLCFFAGQASSQNKDILGADGNAKSAQHLVGDKNGTKALISAYSGEASKRIDSLEARLAKAEERQKQDSGLLHFLKELGEKVIGEMVGFGVLALIFALIVKNELIRAVREGMEKIGAVFAGSFVSSVVPEIINFRRDAISILQSKTFFYDRPMDLKAPQVVDQRLEQIQHLISSHKLNEAESALILLSDQYPEELKIVSELFDLYGSPAYEALSGAIQSAQKALRFVESKNERFSKSPEYFMLVARANCKFENTGKARTHYLKAIAAASEAINIEPENPRWLSLRGLMHDVFGVVVEAVKDTENALKMAENKSDQKNIARAKNNLAFYFAELGQEDKKELALQYANEACEYDRQFGQPIHISEDTLGYVLMSFAETKDELERAVALLGQAVAADPQDAEIASHLSEAKKRLDTFGQFDC